MRMAWRRSGLAILMAASSVFGQATNQPAAPAPVILTPKPAATPCINGPKIFGVRPGSPFLYSIPASGYRPRTFSAVGLFNAGTAEEVIVANWSDLQFTGKQRVRDLWRQKDIGVFADRFEAAVASHGAALVRIFQHP